MSRLIGSPLPKKEQEWCQISFPMIHSKTLGILLGDTSTSNIFDTKLLLCLLGPAERIPTLLYRDSAVELQR